MITIRTVKNGNLNLSQLSTNIKQFVLFSVFLFVCLSGVRAQTAMDIAPQMVPGWNLGNTLEAGPCTWLSNDLDWETGWQPTKTTQRIIDYVKSKGFRSVRIPCSWDMHMDSDHKIKTTWMRRVKQVVDYCIKDSLYVMLNDHWDGGWIEVDGFKDLSEENISKKCEELADMWTQIATAFADYDHHLLFAGMNEPNADDASKYTVLKRYLQTFVDAVRATGGKNADRVLVVQAPCTDVNRSTEYNVLPEDPTPNRLMLEVHFYDPYQFCGMSEDKDWSYRFFYWGKDNHVSGSNYNATWGEESHVQQQMRKMRTNYSSKGMPVIIGEYGVGLKQMPEGEDQDKHNASIRDWHKAVTRFAISNGCVPMVWDTNSGNPVIDRSKCSIGNEFSYGGIVEGVELGKWPFATGIETSPQSSPVWKEKRVYNLMGMPVGKDYRGIVIEDGKKIIR